MLEHVGSASYLTIVGNQAGAGGASPSAVSNPGAGGTTTGGGSNGASGDFGSVVPAAAGQAGQNGGASFDVSRSILANMSSKKS